MTKRLRIGYVPLTDAALLHVAKAQHFATARELDIELVAETSWANIRDKLVAGHFDAAHMLAPAAITVSLGIGQIEAPLMAPVALGLNGNAITVSKVLFEALLQEAQANISNPRVTPPRRFGSTPRWWRPVRPPIRMRVPKPRPPSMHLLSGLQRAAAVPLRQRRRHRARKRFRQ